MGLGLNLGILHYVPPVAYVGSVIILLLALFYRVEIGIYFLTFLLPLQTLVDKLEAYPLGKDLVDLFVLVILVRWAFEKIRRGEAFIEKSPFNWPLYLNALWAYIMLWYGSYYVNLPYPTAINDPRLMEYKALVTMYFLFFAVINNIKSPRQIHFLILVLAASMFISAYRSFQMSGAIRSAGYFSYDMRAAGTFSYLNANQLGAYFAQYSLLFGAIFLVFREVKWQRWFFVATAALAMYSMLFTFSRGGYVATLVGLLFLALLKSRLLLIVMIAFLFTWSYVLPTSVVIRVNMTFTEDGELEESAATRFTLWEQAEHFIQEKPLTGMGFHTSPYLRFISKQGLNKDGTARSLHNGYLQYLVEVGIIGLLLHLWVFFQGIFYGWRIFKRSPNQLYRGLGLGMIVCVLAILASNATSDNWRYLNIMGFFWVSLGLTGRIWVDMQEKAPAYKPQLRHIRLVRRLFRRQLQEA